MATTRTSPNPSDRISRREGLTGEGNVQQRRTEQVEEDETDEHAGEGGDGGFDSGDHRDLPRRGPHEAHRSEALLSTCCCDASGRADEDEHRNEQCQEPYREDDFERHGAEGRRIRAAAVSGHRGDAAYLFGTRYL